MKIIHYVWRDNFDHLYIVLTTVFLDVATNVMCESCEMISAAIAFSSSSNCGSISFPKFIT